MFLKKTEWEDTNKKIMELCNWDQERICTKKGESVSVVEEREERDMWVYSRAIKKRVY